MLSSDIRIRLAKITKIPLSEVDQYFSQAVSTRLDINKNFPAIIATMIKLYRREPKVEAESEL